MHRRRLTWTLSLALFATCTVVGEPVYVAPGYPGCDWVFVDGHWGPSGNWHPAHWRCLGGPDVVVMSPY
jgi:hypothetical protein